MCGDLVAQQPEGTPANPEMAAEGWLGGGGWSSWGAHALLVEVLTLPGLVCVLITLIGARRHHVHLYFPNY